MDNKNTNKPTGSDAGNGSASDDFFVKPPAINLPKGGGAIRGVDEKFQVNPSNGSASQSIPIYTSPARGFEPQLSLNYGSGAGNGLFGFGWSLGLPSISRKTSKSLPRYFDNPAFPERDSDTYILAGAEDIVPDERGTPSADKDKKSPDGKYYVNAYRPRIEGLFARIERWTEIETRISHWRVFSPSDVLTIYGSTSESRIADPEDPTKIFEWLISESFNDKGSAIAYHYKSERGCNIDQSKASESHLYTLSTPVNSYLTKVQYCKAKSIDRQEILKQID